MAAIFRGLVLALMVSRFISVMASDDDPYDAICSPIWGYFPDCAEYLGGLSHHLPEKCCHSIRKLNEIAKKTKKGPKVVCFCIEAYMVPQDFHLKPSRIKKLPKKCHTDILFPISETMNCSLAILYISVTCYFNAALLIRCCYLLCYQLHLEFLVPTQALGVFLSDNLLLLIDTVSFLLTGWYSKSASVRSCKVCSIAFQLRTTPLSCCLSDIFLLPASSVLSFFSGPVAAPHIFSIELFFHNRIHLHS
ncbi:hypothetical protein SADUNF_Sadunf02G0009600 [Salix dunnii]|uniref:Bifunctional inhibitor/plant lipid transfer protein/seed storage helical domain-containing protein n=1 Tax=Salix dunnii TaxID=1413687 RepID=A0A835N5G6_9ROSI|nr:hypothetical protein SADUNF_Sadunf02G0009600 [Salix dunnii]